MGINKLVSLPKKVFRNGAAHFIDKFFLLDPIITFRSNRTILQTNSFPLKDFSFNLSKSIRSTQSKSIFNVQILLL